MKRILQKLGGDQRGNILILTGLGFLFLVGIGGAGYDLGRQQLVRQKIQQASDAAALAAAGMDFGTSDATRQNTAQAFFALNYPNDYLGVARPTPSISIAGETITVGANAPVPTSFVGNFGVSSITAAGTSRVQFKRLQTVIDTILVMDNSGSMATVDVGVGNSLNASGGVRPICRAGWINLYATLFGFALSTADANILCNTFEAASGFNRMNALRFSASALADALMNPNLNDNRMALVTWDMLLINSQNFSNDANKVKTFLGVMYGRGQTISTRGLQQAQNLAGGFRPNVVRSVILMTDGFNNLGAFNSNGTAKTFAQIAADQASINAASLAICNVFKAQGIIVYTIGFGSELVGTNPLIVAADQFLSDCATGPNGAGAPNLGQFYFRAPDAAALAASFSAIAGSLKKVQILQ